MNYNPCVGMPPGDEDARLARRLCGEGLDSDAENLRCLATPRASLARAYRRALRRLRIRRRAPATHAADLDAIEGKLLAGLGRLDEARKILEAVAPKPCRFPALAWLGETLLLAGSPSRARPVLDEAVRRHPRAAWARFWRSCARLALGDRPGAVRDSRAFRGRHPGPAAEALDAMIAASTASWTRALSLLDRAAAQGPAQSWIWELRAGVCRAAGDLPSARRALREALRREPAAARLHAELARCYDALGLPQKALRSAERAARLEPSPERLLLKARLHARWREYPRAIRDFTRVLAARPGDAAARLERSKAYAASGRFGLALADAEAASRAAPAEHHLEAWRTHLLILSGRDGRARKAAARMPRPAARFFWRGCADLRAGRPGAARKSFGRAVALAAGGVEQLRARFYAAASCALHQSAPREGRARVWLIGLGINPPYTASAAALRALARCDVVFNNLAGSENTELLQVLCRRTLPLAYHQYDESGLARRILAAAAGGRTVAFATRGSALFFGPLAAELVRGCRRLGISWRALPSVTTVDFIAARFGLQGLGLGASIWNAAGLASDGVLDPRLAAWVYLTQGVSQARYEAACGRILAAYGTTHPCLVLDHLMEQNPLRVLTGALPRLWARLGLSTILHLPAVSLAEASGAAPPRDASDERPCEEPVPASNPLEARLQIVGLGAEPPRHTTLEALQAMGLCRTLWLEGLTNAQARDLGALLPSTVRLLPRHPADERPLLEALEKGGVVGLATPDHPFYWSATARRLLGLAQERGLPWWTNAAVAPWDIALAQEGWAIGKEVPGLQAINAAALAREAVAWTPRLPLVLFFPTGVSPAELAALARRLRKRYPLRHPLRWWRRDLGDAAGTLEQLASSDRGASAGDILALPLLKNPIPGPADQGPLGGGRRLGRRGGSRF